MHNKRTREQNISIEECFNNLMELDVMRIQLEDVNPHFRQRMREEARARQKDKK